MAESRAFFSDHIINYYKKIVPPKIRLPKGVQWINPFEHKETLGIVEQFYNQYYRDKAQRHFIIGINPGRFGAGITGVPFTDPIRLETFCGIPNTFKKRAELSSIFVYELIDAYGGPRAFYQDFFITSFLPLGFVRNGRNYNYYDDKDLANEIREYAATEIKRQMSFGGNADQAFCLGKGKNYQNLLKLNDHYQLFDEITPLPHPRWIMQYRLKKKDGILREMLKKLTTKTNG